MASRKEQKAQLKQERQEREQADAASTKKRRTAGLIAGIVAVAAVVVVVLVVVSQGGDGGGDSDVKGASDVNEMLSGIDMDGLVMGDKKAPVKVYEFADLQCPACKAFMEETFPEVVKRYVKTGKIQMEIVYLTFIGPDSATAAEAAIAAGKQDGAWHFSDIMYKNQGAENAGYVTDEYLEGIAGAVPDLDIEKWKKDRKSSSNDQKLQDFQTRAEEEGVDSTPSFVVEGPDGQDEFLSGAVDIDGFAAAVDPLVDSK